MKRSRFYLWFVRRTFNHCALLGKYMLKVWCPDSANCPKYKGYNRLNCLLPREPVRNASMPLLYYVLFTISTAGEGIDIQTECIHPE